MSSSKTSERDHQKLMDKIWDEIKKINWNEINEATQMNFSLGVAGTENEIEEILLWLKTNKIDSLFKAFSSSEIKIEENKYFNRHNFEDHIVKFNVENGEIDRRLLLSTDFCITFKKHAEFIKGLKNPVYIYDKAIKNQLANTILSNHKRIEYALSYNIPVFRGILTQKIILSKTAVQNLSWAVVTAAPNIIPGPHQVVAVPIAAISDSVVLTANEIKMLFEIVGVNGSNVNPLMLLPEIGIVLLYGGIAQNLAGSVVQMIPAGVGLAAKGAIAYGFTAAIGESILLYYYTGRKMTKEIFKNIAELYKKEGTKLAEEKAEEIKEQIKKKQKEKKDKKIT